ncbi:hypothetical protein N431DRAFT_428732 [Stipitochalara longipes BDJ]|nr:hypothetical protein N431DRAFT_428732 [Stipitochalara longipes BDJ]
MKTCVFARSTCLLFFASRSFASYPAFDYSTEVSPTIGGYGNASLTEPVHHPLKFSSWYHDFRPDLEEISTTVCNLSLNAYRGDATARSTLGPVKNYCWTHADCVLGTSSERIKDSFAGTSILLGLAPTTLSVLGPSVAEMALLSLKRPFLSLLLSLGAPAVFPGRFLIWDDPLRANEPATGAFLVRPFTQRWAIVVSILQYLVAALCCGNMIDATYQIGIHSIVTWDCPSSHWPLLWVLLSLIIHLTATISLRTAIHRKEDFIIPISNESTTAHSDPRKEFGVTAILRNEITPSSNSRWLVHDLFDIKLGPVPVALQYTGAFISVCHLVFGTLMFSSLLFIGVGDAVVLILRLIASATVSRIVLQFEIGGMMKIDEKRVYKGIVQAAGTEKVE